MNASLNEQMDLIGRGAVEIITTEELEKKISRSIAEKKPLTVKTGFDPTAPDLHLGHTVLIQKMKHFQELGHRVVFLIGDFTGMIGDPSGRSSTREPMTRKQLLINAETYKEQVFKILDKEKTVITFNSTWMKELGIDGFVELSAQMTVARMLEREDFKARFVNNQPISIHEFLYPLVQGYDSVALKADVELGGTDQIFNLLVGRDLQKYFGQPPQVVLTVPILVGTDGVKKMSKSVGNYIGITEPPTEIFGKVMSISDEVMLTYYELLSDIATADLGRLKDGIARGTAKPQGGKGGVSRRAGRPLLGKRAGARGPPGVWPDIRREEEPDGRAGDHLPEERGGMASQGIYRGRDDRLHLGGQADDRLRGGVDRRGKDKRGKRILQAGGTARLQGRQEEIHLDHISGRKIEKAPARLHVMRIGDRRAFHEDLPALSGPPGDVCSCQSPARRSAARDGGNQRPLPRAIKAPLQLFLVGPERERLLQRFQGPLGGQREQLLSPGGVHDRLGVKENVIVCADRPDPRLFQQAHQCRRRLGKAYHAGGALVPLEEEVTRAPPG